MPRIGRGSRQTSFSTQRFSTTAELFWLGGGVILAGGLIRGAAYLVFRGTVSALTVAGFGVLLAIQILLVGRLARQIWGKGQERARFLQTAVDGAEQERWRLASALHDGPVQNLAAVNFALGSMALRLNKAGGTAPTNEELREVMEDAAEQSRIAIRELRSMIVEIAPPDLQNGGLGPALSRLGELAKSQGLTVVVDVSQGEGMRSADVALVFRTAQECIRNVVEHAQASKLSIKLYRSGESFVLEIADNGKGFSSEEMNREQAEGHVGLALLGERASQVGAKLLVASDQGRGTAITLRLANA